MQRSRITIIDLAQELGMSKSTVSRALRHHPNVSKATRERVLAKAKELNYRPNRIAQNLVHRQTRTIGVVIPDVSFPYFSKTLSAAQKAAEQAGYQIMICQSGESFQAECRAIDTLVDNQIDGLLISLSQETQDYEHLVPLLNDEVPVVMFDRVIESKRFPRVVMDNHGGAKQAVEHLVQQGYRRIAHLAGPETLMVSQQRVVGYLDAHEATGLPVDESLVLNLGFRREHGEAGVRQLFALDNPPDAILAVTDSVAIGAKLALEALGKRIPDEVGLVGFNNEAFTEYVEPMLSTVSLPMAELGKKGMEMLLAHLNGAENPVADREMLGASLIVRESSKGPSGKSHD
ncbi:MAG: LacI family DNA-binding transcriptional regulator [Bacteroidota bacterium]